MKKIILLILLTSLSICINAQEIRINKTKVISDYIRDEAKEVVIDIKSNLMWQDNKTAKTVKKNWEGAKSYCQNLDFAGYSDWYLPTIKELESIAETTNHPRVIAKVFENMSSDTYWSSSVVKSEAKFAWSVRFKYSSSNNIFKKNVNCVRCVRAGQ